MDSKWYLVQAEWASDSFSRHIDFLLQVRTDASMKAIRQFALENLLSRLSNVGVLPDAFSINVEEMKI